MSHHGGTFLFNTIPMENDFGISDFLGFALLTSVVHLNYGLVPLVRHFVLLR